MEAIGPLPLGPHSYKFLTWMRGSVTRGHLHFISVSTSMRTATISSLIVLLILLIAPISLNAQPSQWRSIGMGGGGALFLPSISPYDGKNIFIACDMTELFHSTDRGESWGQVHFSQLECNSVHGLVQFTDDPSILYTINYREETPEPAKSTDGGTTWKSIADPTGGSAIVLYTDIHSHMRLILVAPDAIYISNDGGATFTSRYSGSDLTGAGAFFDGNTVYVGTSAGMLSSSNGGTFAPVAASGIPSGETIVSLAGAKKGGTTRLLCVTLNAGNVDQWVTGASHDEYAGVYTLDVGNASWTSRTSAIGSNRSPFFAAMATDNINIAYVAGYNDATGGPLVLKTTDGGGSWSDVFKTAGNQNIATGWSGNGGDREWSYGEFAEGFIVSPNDPNELVITDLGFPHLSTDGGATWKQIYLNSADQNAVGATTPKGKAYRGVGIENTTCWSIAWADSLHMVAGFSDIRGIISDDGGISWSQNYSGHTLNSMYCVIKHPTSGTLYAGTSSVHDMYQSTYLTDARIDNGQGQVLFSTDKGRTWSMLHNFQHPVFWVAADPKNPNRLYASVIHSTQGGIYVSSDIQNGASSTWTKLASPPRTQGHPFSIRVLDDGTLVASFSGRRTNAFTNSSGVFVSSDNGASWSDRSGPGLLYWTKDLVIDPNDVTQKTWYACVFSGWGGTGNDLGGLYRTNDRGITWNRVFTMQAVTSVTMNPDDPHEAYLTTEQQGLWHTADITAASPQFTLVDGYPFKQPERVFFNPYRRGEVWVTSFGNGLRVGSTVQQPQVPAAPMLIAPRNDSAMADNSGNLVWSAVSGATSYDIQLGTSPNFVTNVIDRIGVDSTSVYFDRLDVSSGPYFWRVRAVNAIGAGPWSAVWRFRIYIPLGVDDIASNIMPSLICYPNPFTSSSTIDVRLATRQHVNLTLVDIHGRTITTFVDGMLDQGVHMFRYDALDLPSGVYWCCMVVGGRVVVQKVLR